jgi:hypothetical protein
VIAQKWAQKAREAVPLLGSEKAVIEELLGAIDMTDGRPHASMEGVAVYLVMDGKREVCSGVYVVGESKDVRQQGLKIDYLPSLLLSRSVGHPAQVVAPAKPLATSREAPVTITTWTDGNVPVVARWREGVFVELRVGDASPGGTPTPARGGAFGRGPLLKFTAFPGGQVLVDGVAYGRDSVGPIRVRAGKHEVKIKNRFLGDYVHAIEVKDGDVKVIVQSLDALYDLLAGRLQN